MRAVAAETAEHLVALILGISRESQLTRTDQPNEMRWGCGRRSTGPAEVIGVVIPELLEDAIRVELAQQVLVYAHA